MVCSFTDHTKNEIVIIEYLIFMETFYLLKSPKNAKRLLNALNQYNVGKGEEHQLLEPCRPFSWMKLRMIAFIRKRLTRPC